MGLRSREPRPDWKPVYFHIYYILPLILLHIAHIAGLQILVNQYKRDSEKIALVQTNTTTSGPHESIFIFDEANGGTFVLWQYLPIIIITCFALLWESVDLNVRRLEPFHQLASSDGGTVDNALCLDYVTMFSFVVPYQAARRKHWPVTISSALYLLVFSIVPTFTGGVFRVNWASLTYSSGKIEGPKFATVSLSPGFIVVTQIFHAFAAALGIALYVTLRMRQSGLYRDPKGIGSLASLISESDALPVLQQIPSYTHSDNLKVALQGTRFYLRHLNDIGTAESFSHNAYQLKAQVHSYVQPPPRSYTASRKDGSSFWLQRRMVWIAEAFFTVAFGLIMGFLFRAASALSSSDISDNVKITAAKVVYTFCITIAGSMWQSIQRDVQAFEPWRQLAFGNNPKRLYDSLVRSDMLSVGLVVSLTTSIARLALISCWAAFASLMMRIAVIFLPPLFEIGYAAGLVDGRVSRPSGTTYYPGALQGSCGYALIGVGIAVHVVAFLNAIVFTYSGRCRPFMPRAPKTLASQLLYLCRSRRLLSDFSGTSMLSSAQLAERLRTVGRTCQFGWFWWHGNQWFVGVEEPIQGGFVRFDFHKGIYGTHEPL